MAETNATGGKGKKKGDEANSQNTGDAETNATGGKGKKKGDKDETVEKRKPGFYVAEGQSLTCLKGIVGAGDEIKAKDIAGGVEVLNELIEKELVEAQE